MLFHPERGIHQLFFPGKAPVLPFPKAELPWAGLQTDMDRYLGGEQINFTYPLDLTDLSQFNRKVLKVVSQISYGEVLSYRGVAELVGSPLACRAVGRVMATNRFPLLIPCHRVIKASGNIGGFGAGESWKKHLLELEGGACAISVEANRTGHA